MSFHLFSVFLILISNEILVDCQFFRPGYEPQSVINSLLTPIMYAKRSECAATSDNRIGLCMSKAACISSGGYVTGVCNFVLSCCVYQGTCKSVISANETYFVSPQYPTLHSERLDPPICIFTLVRNTPFVKWPVCQVRLDFDEFSLAPPINGTCGRGQTDSFIISGATNFNQSGLPGDGLCGELTSQHVYLDVDPNKTDDPLLLIVNTANEQRFNRKWSIRIQQVPCQSPYRGNFKSNDITFNNYTYSSAPNGCLQYHTGKMGTIESLNFRGIGKATPVLSPGQTSIGIGFPGQQISPFTSPNYFNNMHYGICIAKHAKSCAIKWSAVNFDFGGFKRGVSSTELTTEKSAGCVASGSLEDIGDYVLIPASSVNGRAELVNRLCGQYLNPRLTDQSYNEDVLSYVKPFILVVHSDSFSQLSFDSLTPFDQKGFQIKYEQILC